jgi:lysophospholipase L1-like esterase
MDAAGNVSQLTTTAVTTAAPSNLPPSVPTNVRVTDFSDSFVSLAWDASTDDSGVSSYRIYRNGVKMPFAPTSPNFIDTTVQPGTTYTYSIRSADNGGLFSGYSDGPTVTTAVPAAHNPYSGIGAADFDGSSGVSVSGSDLSSLDNNDWVKYSNVQFGSGAKSVAFELALAPSSRGGTIELRLDSANGALIGSHVVQPTGSSSTFIVQRTNIADVSGTHDLYVVFKNRSDVARLREITFSTTHLTRIMPLGDSITEGAQNPLTSTYRYYLWQKLLGAGINDVDFVGSRTQAQNDVNPPNWNLDQNHEGHSGWTADQIAAQAAGWAQTFQPEIVILHIGTNDLHNGQSVTSTVNEIEQIIDELRGVLPNVTVLLAQILPLVGHESDVSLLNQGIADLAAEMDSGNSRIILVDLNSGFTLNDMQDGIHPKPEVESAMADRLYAALAPLLQ